MDNILLTSSSIEIGTGQDKEFISTEAFTAHRW